MKRTYRVKVYAKHLTIGSAEVFCDAESGFWRATASIAGEDASTPIEAIAALRGRMEQLLEELQHVEFEASNGGTVRP